MTRTSCCCSQYVANVQQHLHMCLMQAVLGELDDAKRLLVSAEHHHATLERSVLDAQAEADNMRVQLVNAEEYRTIQVRHMAMPGGNRVRSLSCLPLRRSAICTICGSSPSHCDLAAQQATAWLESTRLGDKSVVPLQVHRCKFMPGSTRTRCGSRASDPQHSWHRCSNESWRHELGQTGGSIWCAAVQLAAC